MYWDGIHIPSISPLWYILFLCKILSLKINRAFKGKPKTEELLDQC